MLAPGHYDRARQAKDDAFDDKRAQSLIALARKGDAKSVDELRTLAGDGNARAAAFLAGIDSKNGGNGPKAGAPLTPTAQAQALSGTPTAPSSVTPGAGVSSTAQSGAGPASGPAALSGSAQLSSPTAKP